MWGSMRSHLASAETPDSTPVPEHYQGNTVRPFWPAGATRSHWLPFNASVWYLVYKQEDKPQILSSNAPASQTPI